MMKAKKKKLPYERRPGKRGVFAEFPTELVIAFRERAAQAHRSFRQELELAAQHWLNMPVGFIPDAVQKQD